MAAAAASSSSSLTFAVRRSEPVLVPPAEPTPYELKPLSDIDDQESLRFYRSGIYFFRNSPSKIGQDPVAVVRSAVAKALVHYYPLAGRILEGPGRKLAVECTGEGVVFVGADADVTLEDFGGDLSPPIPCNEKLLCEPESSSADIIGRPLLFIQVTRMKCGGFIFAVQICHCMADAAGLVQLLIDIGELARGPTPLSAPGVGPGAPRRPVPAARHAPAPGVRGGRRPRQGPHLPADALVHRRFFFRDEEETAYLLPHHRPALRRRRRSPNTVRGERPGKRRISKQPQLPRGFYGNAFAFAVASSTAGELCERPFGYALQLVTEAKARVLDVGYLQSVSDLMVLKARPRFAVARTYLVSDLTKSGLRAVDFGWGEGCTAVRDRDAGDVPHTGGGRDCGAGAAAAPGHGEVLYRIPEAGSQQQKQQQQQQCGEPLGRVDSGLDLGSASGLGPISKL
uniref:Benzyl alcohol O-benzoyltransferase n=1 Tax=Ananas comosus var. bracteatus TaxID=296719 RepID=A0A6V7NQR0_ANACO|nr:unnamed protein product [Ananas comosus var. bracteatus]